MNRLPKICRVVTEEMSVEDAKNTGAMALLGENMETKSCSCDEGSRGE